VIKYISIRFTVCLKRLPHTYYITAIKEVIKKSVDLFIFSILFTERPHSYLILFSGYFYTSFTLKNSINDFSGYKVQYLGVYLSKFFILENLFLKWKKFHENGFQLHILNS